MKTPKLPNISMQTVFSGLVMSIVVGAAWYGIRKAAVMAGPAVSNVVEKAANIAE